MHIGVLTTSWPSTGRAWAGHFVRDQAEHLARLGCRVTVLAPSWGEHGSPLVSGELEVIQVPVPGSAGSLKGRRGLRVLRCLRRAAARWTPDLWLCHWWPTVLAAPGAGRCVAVLHGSDVDLLERMPRSVSRWLDRRCEVVGVSGILSRRFAHMSGGPAPRVHGIGARAEDGLKPDFAPRWWLDSQAPRILTVGRDHPGKGLDVAREAARLSPGLAWLQVSPSMGIGPSGVRSLMAQAQVLVVPSLGGAEVPTEGRPHVIAQATVAGLPMVGGPNPAVRSAMRELGQVEVPCSGPRALKSAVYRCLAETEARRSRLEPHRDAWDWENLVGQQWMPTLKRVLAS